MFYRSFQNKLADALRFLSIDAIQAAHSGHPGMPMGMADIAEVLWNNFLVHNPNNPEWWNRDRFILSNGHGSALHYALLHLTGYLSIEDLKNFRQLHSKTPGHPEYGVTKGIAATTGPLGQGLGMAVGMALAEQLLNRAFNKTSFPIIDNYTYCFVGDGCLMEGVSHEVCSLAGTLGLNKLIVFWDDNKISIDGNTNDWFTENIPQRFQAYNWNVIDNIDGHDPGKIHDAILAARSSLSQPSLLCCKTIIGFGSSFAGTAKVHGAAFHQDELIKIRKNLDWNYPEFYIPQEIYSAWQKTINKGATINKNWDLMLQQYKIKYPGLYTELERRISGKLPANLNTIIDAFIKSNLNYNKSISTRKSSNLFLEYIIGKLPELFGGSADLANSDLTLTTHSIAFSMDQNNIFNYLHFGVREFGMFCILNGMALYKGFIPYGGTFLAFIDYAKNALRLSAMMRQKIIYILTHDSIGVGEDGPTHQPIEHLVMLRAIPNLSVWRPCDFIETIIAWQKSLERNEPSCIILSRQNLIQQQHHPSMIINISKGGYILYEPKNINDVTDLKAIVIATGSEIQLAINSVLELAAYYPIRVVSMPNIGLFLQQPKEYQEKVLPDRITARLSIEAGSTLGWYQFTGATGTVLGIDRFGLSAPGQEIFTEYNFTIEHIKELLLNMINSL